MSQFDFVPQVGPSDASCSSLALHAPNQHQARVITRQSSENSDLVNQRHSIWRLFIVNAFSTVRTKQSYVCLSVRLFPDSTAITRVSEIGLDKPIELQWIPLF
jgi:hypothetical protein